MTDPSGNRDGEVRLAQAQVIDVEDGIATIEAFLIPVPDPEWIRVFGHLRNVIDRAGGPLYVSTEAAALLSEVSWRVEQPFVEDAIGYLHARVAATNEEFARKFAID